MPISKYDRYYGNKKGGAQEALSAMEKEYGAKKGKQVFYATKNKKKSSQEKLAHKMAGKAGCDCKH